MDFPEVKRFEVGVSYKVTDSSSHLSPLPEKILSRGQKTITISHGTFDVLVVGLVETAQLGNSLWLLADEAV